MSVEKKAYQLLLSTLLVMLLVLMAYHGAGKHQFVGWDDTEYVTTNPLVKNANEFDLKEIFSTVISLNYHPVTILSMRVNSNKCPDCPDSISAAPFIRWNIFLHLLNSIFVFLLLYLLSGRKIPAAFIAAALFAVHPMHVESVAWVSERKDVLYTFFFLAGLLTYIKFIDTGKRKYLWLGATFILFLLSCLSKAMAVVFPLILILIDFWFYKSEKSESVKQIVKNFLSRRNILVMVPFFIISLIFGLIATSVQSGHNFLGLLRFINRPNDVVDIVGPFSALQKVQIGSFGFVSYLLKFFLPVNLSPYYPYPPLSEFSHGTFPLKLWISVLASLAILLFSIISLRKSKLVFFCMGFYLLTLILVLQVLSVGTAIMAERYSYLPYAGLAFLPATLIAESPKKIRNILFVLAGAIIIVFTALTRKQVKVWSNSGTLWTQVIEKYPQLELARKARGKYYYLLYSRSKDDTEKKRLEIRALTDFDIAMRAGTKDAAVYDASGVILENNGDNDRALLCLDKAVSLKPTDGGIYYNRAMVLDVLGRKDESIRDYSTALNLAPNMSVKILSNRAVLLTETGRYAEAERDLDRLIAAISTDYMYYYNRAFARLKQNKIYDAVEDYRAVIKLHPGDEQASEALRMISKSLSGQKR
jgi:protein O-mannosyl-transferase